MSKSKSRHLQFSYPEHQSKTHEVANSPENAISRINVVLFQEGTQEPLLVRVCTKEMLLVFALIYYIYT